MNKALLITEGMGPALRGLALHLLPPPTTTCLDWSDAERILSPESSAQPGKYTSAKAPYQRGPLIDVTDENLSGFVLMWAAQLGKTEIIGNIVGFHIDQDPAPILMVQPTVDLGEAWSIERLNPMIRDTPALRGKVSDARSRDGANKTLFKVFRGGNIAIVGANAPAGLAGRPRRIILLDEVDRYPPSAGKEGDPCALAEKRAESFHNALIVKTSTPTIRGSSRIEAEYEASDQQKWWCPCPKCRAYQVLQWSQIKWPKDEPEEAYLECSSCGEHLTDRQRVAMVRAGEWRATCPRRRSRGYWLNGICTVFRARRGFRNRLHQMVADFIKAKELGTQTLRVWINTFLAETWQEDTERIPASELEKRAESYRAVVPEPVLILTAGVDVQVDRLVYEIIGWGVGEESWGLEARTIPGRPDDPKTWKKLDEALQQSHKKEDGTELKVLAVGVDSGNWADYVLKFTRTRFARGFIAIKGSNQAGAPIVSAVRRNNRYKAASLSVGTDQAKTLIYSRLKLTEPGLGYCHFPDVTQGYDAQFYSELTAEELRISFKRGFAVRLWHKAEGRRNEALDVRVYALAILRWLNPDWVRVAARAHAQKPEPPVVPADPVAPGTIAPEPGPQTGPALQAVKARPRPVRPMFDRGFIRNWRRY